MIAVDLCSGGGNATKAFLDAGWEVITVDNDPKFRPTIVGDVRTLSLKVRPDFVWASPPCNCFSVASVKDHWKGDWPAEAFEVVAGCLRMIAEMHPRYWVMENPRAMLRTLLGRPARETTFAAWDGGGHLKPTDLWGIMPPMHWLQPETWTPSKRGSPHPPSDIPVPYALSKALCEAIR